MAYTYSLKHKSILKLRRTEIKGAETKKRMSTGKLLKEEN